MKNSKKNEIQNAINGTLRNGLEKAKLYSLIKTTKVVRGTRVLTNWGGYEYEYYKNGKEIEKPEDLTVMCDNPFFGYMKANELREMAKKYLKENCK